MSVISAAQQRYNEVLLTVQQAQKNVLNAPTGYEVATTSQQLEQAYDELTNAEQTLTAAQKTANLMGVSALGGGAFSAVGAGIDALAKTGVTYGTSLQLANATQQATQAGFFGLGALNTLNGQLDDATKTFAAETYADKLFAPVQTYAQSFSPASTQQAQPNTSNRRIQKVADSIPQPPTVIMASTQGFANANARYYSSNGSFGPGTAGIAR